MDTHKSRKEATRRGLKRATDDGVQYEHIAEATQIKPESLRGFASRGKLGPDKTIALLTYLTEQGYMKEPQTNLRLLPPVNQPIKDPWVILSEKLNTAASIFGSPVYSNSYKLIEFREFAQNITDYFAIHLDAIDAYDQRP